MTAFLLRRDVVLFTLVISLLVSSANAGNWSRFRGSQGTGLAASQDKLPTEIGPGVNQLWRTELPPGHSSPAIVGDRIFLTAVKGTDKKELLTIGLDRATGKIQWEAPAPYEKLEGIHSIGSHAQSSPCADADVVVSFFGSSGLYCYDHSGKKLWSKPMGPFNNDFGAGSSPQLVGDKIILCQDHDLDSFLMAIDKKTGETAWKTDRSEFPRNYCTPIIWDNAGQKQIVIAATLRVVGYDLETGKEAWTVRGISRSVSCSPTIGDDGNLYIAGWAAGGDDNEKIRVEPYDSIVYKDKDQSGTLEEAELQDGPVYQRFTQADRNKDGKITPAEYEFFRSLFADGKNMVISIKPGAKGEATDTSVRWRHARLVPFCASPLYVDGLVFTVKDGGVLQCLNAGTGKQLKQLRLEASDSYYASPVGGDGKVYVLDEIGRLTVISATDQAEVLHTADFKEDVFATPAIVDGRIYLRTAKALYC
ncbi:MAG TPA: PQQ-binding-like beta-propeller repeat protein, partial [Schlesneria sp.]